MGIIDTVKNGWNAFTSRDPTKIEYSDIGPSYSITQDRPRLTRGNDKTIANSVYNRMAVDTAATTIIHARTDSEGRFLEVMEGGLNDCLTLEANIDQTHRSFISDIVISMCDEGYVAVLPIDTKGDPDKTESYEILSMRVGQIIEWYPRHVKVRVYNDRTGLKEDLIFPKKDCAIIENPFYNIMNEPNSILQRLIRKLNLLDSIDNDLLTGKLNMLVHLPYIVRGETRREQAKNRMRNIQNQLNSDNKYGIAYIDGAEKVTQLNRPLDNHLMSEIEYLTNMFFSQLGITKEIMEGTADEKTMRNYYNRTIEPILSAISDEFKRKFLSKTARTQKQTVMYFRDPFKLVPINEIADIADKFTRNEITTSNEMRQVIGLKPSSNPAADDLRNKNIIATQYGNVDGNDVPEIEERLIDEEYQ